MQHDENDICSWETQNIGLAAALVARGYELVAVDSRGFRFWESEEGFLEAVASYQSGICFTKSPELYRVIRLLDHLAESTGMILTSIHDYGG